MYTSPNLIHISRLLSSPNIFFEPYPPQTLSTAPTAERPKIPASIPTASRAVAQSRRGRRSACALCRPTWPPLATSCSSGGRAWPPLLAWPRLSRGAWPPPACAAALEQYVGPHGCRARVAAGAGPLAAAMMLMWTSMATCMAASMDSNDVI